MAHFDQIQIMVLQSQKWAICFTTTKFYNYTPFTRHCTDGAFYDHLPKKLLEPNGESKIQVSFM